VSMLLVQAVVVATLVLMSSIACRSRGRSRSRSRSRMWRIESETLLTKEDFPEAEVRHHAGAQRVHGLLLLAFDFGRV
jgi:hypothetical protein